MSQSGLGPAPPAPMSLGRLHHPFHRSGSVSATRKAIHESSSLSILHWRIALARSVFEIVVVIEGRAGARRLRRRRTLQELRRVALARLARFARRALGRIAADLRLQLYDVEEDVGLTAQLGGNHRRLRGDGGDHG